MGSLYIAFTFDDSIQGTDKKTSGLTDVFLSQDDYLFNFLFMFHLVDNRIGNQGIPKLFNI